jgi:molecular chaperone HtpG
MLTKLAKDEPEKFQGFWKEFGRVLKEGPAEDHENSKKIAALLRFSSTHTDQETQNQSLPDYVERKQEGQDKIWYVTADSFAAARSSPQLEAFRKRGIEVLLLSDPIDEWLMGHLAEFDGLELRDVRRGALELGDKSEDEKPEKDAGEHQALLERLKERLKERAADVRTTDRLTESAACLALGEYDMGAQMRRILAASGQTAPDSKPVFEINPAHPLIVRLAAEHDEQRFGDLADVIFDQASLADGRQLEDPGAFVLRLNRLLLELGA